MKSSEISGLFFRPLSADAQRKFLCRKACIYGFLHAWSYDIQEGSEPSEVRRTESSEPQGKETSGWYSQTQYSGPGNPNAEELQGRIKMEEKKMTQQMNDKELEDISRGYLFNASVLYEYDVLPWQILDRH